MMYLGMKFKNYEELKEWNKKGHISYYKNLVVLFHSNPTMEASDLMDKEAATLHDLFDMDWDVIDELEISTLKTL